LRRDAASGVTTVGIAVSGGPDSVFLLREIVGAWRPGLPRLAVISVDHTTRGAESESDVAFVARLAAELSLPFRAVRADPSRLLNGSEARLRAERYRLLEQAAGEMCCGALYLGHHRDDQIETILLAALRGAGLRGLSGMRRRRPLGVESRITLVRPLLDVPGAAIRAALAARGIPFNADPSNDDLRYLRNRVRHVTLPALRGANRETIDRRIVRLGRIARIAWRAARRRAERGATDSDALHARLLALAGGALSKGASQDAQRQLAGRGGVRADLAPEIRVTGCATDLRVENHAPPTERRAALRTFRGAQHATRLLAAIERVGKHAARDHAARRGVSFADPASIRGELNVRRRRPGDRFRPLGAPSEPKLKDLLIDRGVPRALRDRLVILADDEGIVAVEGLPIAARCALTPDSRGVLRIRFRADGATLCTVAPVPGAGEIA
jgi:tRNA(Ile)-lysidine synthase